MKRTLFFIFVLIFLVGIVIPVEAQQQKKKDRWELELSYGQFWVVKQTWATNLIFEKTHSPDMQLSFRLRVWRGWYIGLIGGAKKEIQNCYFTDEIYSNYFWLEDRFGNFLTKNYTERFITDFRNNLYVGIETKLNLFSINFSKSVSLIPYGKAGIKKWFSIADGFTRTKDYILFDLDRSTTIPYVFYHGEIIPAGNWKAKGREIFWMANPDGSRGNVLYDKEWESITTKTKTGIILFYGGGISFRCGRIILSGEFQIEQRKDIEMFPPQLGGENNVISKFQHAMWRVGVGYRF